MQAQTLVQLHRREFSPLGTDMKPVANRSPVLTDKREKRRVLKGNQDWPLGSCCLRETRAGDYQATRLEGREERSNGRIVDSFCESGL
jgi:hypothetical protein